MEPWFLLKLVGFYKQMILILFGPIRIGLTFTRASSARPSRQLGFPNLLLLLLLLLLQTPLEVVPYTVFVYVLSFIVNSFFLC